MRFAYVIYIRVPYAHAIISLLSNALVHKKQYRAILDLYFGKRTVHATPPDKFENSTLFVCLGLPPILIDYLIQSSGVSLTSLIVVADCLCSQGFLSAISCSSNEYFHALFENRCHNFAQFITDSTPESWMRQRFTYVYIFDITWSQIFLMFSYHLHQLLMWFLPFSSGRIFQKETNREYLESIRGKPSHESLVTSKAH